MAELSILIPARNEEWLARTIADVLANSRADTEIIAVLDGAWADPPVVDHPKVRLVYQPQPIGQRAATNLAARLSTATYVMKLDAHCAVAEGFDAELIRAAGELGPDVTQIAQMRNLHVFDRHCTACGQTVYQGPMTVACEKCQRQGTLERVVVWEPRPGTRTEFWRFDHDLHFQYDYPFKHRQEAKGDLVDVMSSVGAYFFMRRERFWQLGGLDIRHGSWGQFGTEIACKSWLSGGRQVVNKRTWIAHLFRTQGSDFGFPYQIKGSDQEKARAHSRQLWLENTWAGQVRPLSWLVDKFAPIVGWHLPEKENDPTDFRLRRLEDVRVAGERFLAEKGSHVAA